jgi:hypothetical protein
LLSGSTFTDNQSSFFGGGIENGGNAAVSDTTFTGNDATLAGGGINNDGTLAVSGSIFDGNQAQYGGGYSAGQSATITGSTLTTAGTGNDVLIGGAGKNTLSDTGTGANILIGGGGDTLTGNGDDSLISGTTNYDSNTGANIAALDTILAEWSSSDSYSLRISKIMGGITVGSSTVALSATTCQSDGVVNTVSDGTAATQNNWFIVKNKDKVTKQAGETEIVV